ncbi:MAG: DUF1566 domain-containing protein [Deltaproteobacteria bacterium]|nr:DUF1566 domain-containing protein [Deltaproteobacteria bacterium]
MKQSSAVLFVLFLIMSLQTQPAHAIKITKAVIKEGVVQVKGIKAAKNAVITWEGQPVAVTHSKPGGAFGFSTTALPQDCVGDLSDGTETIQVVIENCTILPPPPLPPPAQPRLMPATGQTTSYQAFKLNGGGPQDVPDDGTLQLGANLQYVNTELTVIDCSTGLEWEKKTAVDLKPDSANLHDADNTYRWSGNGSQQTIWDWLDAVNGEGGTGYAGFSDWRIPNIREIHSTVHFGQPAVAVDPITLLPNPAIDPLLGPTRTLATWSSTTSITSPASAWAVFFLTGAVQEVGKSFDRPVRAVRGPVISDQCQ